jgi:hypothetical protein
MEESVARAREKARSDRDAGDPIDPSAVRALFRSGSDGARITALGFMQGDPATADLDIVLEVVAVSRSAFEQAYALAVAEEMSRRSSLDRTAAERLVVAAEAALATERVRTSRSRRQFAESIVQNLRPNAPSDG